MSGAEVVAVLGLISSVISIVDGTKQVYSAVSDTKGLPEAFVEVAARLPIIQTILESARKRIEEDGVAVKSYEGAKEVMEKCKTKTQKLDKLFQKVMPADGATRSERYLAAVKTLGKGSRVETLMQGILVDVQLLAISNNLVSETGGQGKELANAIKKIETLPPSLPENATDETGFTAIHSGSGAINQSQGDQFNNPGSGHIYNAHTMNFGSNDIKENGAQDAMRALFQSLGTDPRDDRDNLVQRKGLRVDGTLTWIKSNENYKTWSDSKSELLWISGGPGTGKTMLSIFLAQEFDRISSNEPQATCIEFFCDNKDEKRNTADSVIRALLYQLLQARPQVLNHILPAFNIQKHLLFSTPSISSLWRIFQNMVSDSDLGPVYCIVDGLDECDEGSLEMLLRRIKELFATSSPNSSSRDLKLILVSRELPEILPELLEDFPRVNMDPDANEEVNQDIAHFIDVKINDLSSHRGYSDALATKVKQIFQDRAQGTFLWVGIVAETLRRFRPSEVEEALESFPSGLNELYARMLLQIRLDRRQIAAKIIRWVVMAVRPLYLYELGEVINPTVKSPAEFSREDIMRDLVLQCGYFLTIKNDQVHLIHQSAKDYILRRERDSDLELEDFRVHEIAAHSEMARYCFDYLQNGSLSSLSSGKADFKFRVHEIAAYFEMARHDFDYLHNRSLSSRTADLKRDVSPLVRFPMLAYAISYWFRHAMFLDPSDAIFDLSHPFYNEVSSLRDLWLRSLFAPFPPDFESAKLLHIASYLGITPLVTRLLTPKGFIQRMNGSRYVNTRGAKKMTALHWAIYGKEEEIVRLLLDKGADIKAKNIDGWTAMHIAALVDQEAMLRLFLEKGAEIEARNRKGWTVMYTAVRGGHTRIVRLLLTEGADIEARDDEGRTSFLGAVVDDNETMIRLLLEKGADIETKDNEGSTAFHEAVLNNNDAMLRFLLERGVNIEAMDHAGKTALHSAVIQANEATLRLVLELGANIEAKNFVGKTALHVAVIQGNEMILRLLLEHGANVEAEDHIGKTTLQVAVIQGNENIARLLLEAGADIEACPKIGLTALHFACSQGRKEMVGLLLEKGARVDGCNGAGDTGLIFATMSGDQAIIRLLVENGADVNAKAKGGYTPLSAAEDKGLLAIVELLKSLGSSPAYSALSRFQERTRHV